MRHFNLPFLVCMDILQLFRSERNRFKTVRQKCVQFLAPFSTILKLAWATNLFRPWFSALGGQQLWEKAGVSPEKSTLFC